MNRITSSSRGETFRSFVSIHNRDVRQLSNITQLNNDNNTDKRSQSTYLTLRNRSSLTLVKNYNSHIGGSLANSMMMNAPLLQKRGFFWRSSPPPPSTSLPSENNNNDTTGTPSIDAATEFTNDSNIPVQISPEDEMAKFELNATAAAERTAELTVAGTDGQIWQSTWWPQDQMVDFIVYVHDASGLNYALTIGAITLAFRSLMFPMFIKAQQNSSRMAHVKPEMDVLKAKIDRLDPKDIQKQQEYAKEMQRLFKKYDVNPLRALIIPFIQMPVFMSMFFALKKMPDIFPDELSSGGILWFTDLTAPDPYYALPIFSGVSFLAMMELSKKSMLASSPEQGQMMLNFFRGMAFIIVPVSMYFPTAVLCYWTVNNTFSLGQSALFNNPTIRKQMGIWEAPKPVPGAPPPKGMFDMIQDSMNNKRKEGNETNLKQRIELHNAAVDERKKSRKSRK